MRQRFSAFTLIEALVAIGILTVAFVGPMTLLMRSIAAAPHTELQAAAISFAREPIEYLKHVRDEDFARAVTFLVNGGDPQAYGDALATTLAPCLSSPCAVDPVEGRVFPCNPQGGCFLTYNATKGLYSHTTGSGWKPTSFQRWILVSRNPSEGWYRVESIVRFPEKGSVREVKADRVLYSLADAAVELYRTLQANQP